ncbi:MAG: hypothetical protein ACKVPX_08265 [Myxococcaceae bacterium]
MKRTLLFCVAFVGLLKSAHAAEFRSGEEIHISAGEVISDDLYISGTTVRIAGRVQGDLFVAGRDIEVTGPVDGNITAAAATMKLRGSVGRSIRAVGNDLTVASVSGGDIFLAGADVAVDGVARVGRDLVVAGADVSVEGPVGRKLLAAGSDVRLNAPVSADASVYAESLKLGDNASIAGTLRMATERSSGIPPGTKIETLERPMAPKAMRGPLWFLSSWVRLAMGLLVLGLVLSVVSPRLVEKTPAMVKAHPWKSLGWGAALLLGGPIAAAVIFVVGLLVGGWWLGPLALAVLFAALTLSLPLMGLFLGQQILPRLRSKPAKTSVTFVTGVVLLALLIRLPFLGALVFFGTALFGVGALVLAGAQLRRAGEGTAAV